MFVHESGSPLSMSEVQSSTSRKLCYIFSYPEDARPVVKPWSYLHNLKLPVGALKQAPVWLGLAGV